MRKEDRKEARRLRQEERLSYGEISKRLDVPKSTLSYWLRDVPLSPEEKEKKRVAKDAAAKRRRNKEAEERLAEIESGLHRLLNGRSLSPPESAKVSEAAVQLRLLLHGFEVYGSPFDGDKADWVIREPVTGRLLVVQVKSTRQGQHGLPYVCLTRSGGRRKHKRYEDHEFDVIVGYDLYRDKAYVFTKSDVASNSSTVTICEEAEEAWWKLWKLLKV